jgi:PKD repeat protein
MLPVLTIILFGLASPSRLTAQSLGLSITAQTNQQTYRLRQKAIVNGSITLDGSPATDLVVAVEVNKPSPWGPYSYRTLQVGNPVEPWLVNITNISLEDVNENPIDTIEAGSQMYVTMTMDNTNGGMISIYATITVYDANMVPIGTDVWTATMSPLQSANSTFEMQVPSTATPGKALIIGCVFSKEPASGGIAYSPEKAFYYCISQTQTGLLGITQPPPPSPQTTPGAYADEITLPPDPVPGEYSVYVLGQSSPNALSSATTSFTVQSTNGIPPQASFAYSPPNPAVNVTVSFDGSSSSPEGYNDIITRYDWNFGDGTPDYVSTGTPASPTATHSYTQAATYMVTLNVTNNEGLWCTTSKPIIVSPGYGPTANFTWTPQSPLINQTVVFDGLASTPGDFSTLVNYTWNFGDGTGLFSVSTSKTTHSYTHLGNYTVTLTVLDSFNRTSSTSVTVQVQNATVKKYDLNGDGVIDGKDIVIVAIAFGSAPGLPNWNPVADVNGDGVVDGKDIALVALHFGQDP